MIWPSGHRTRILAILLVVGAGVLLACALWELLDFPHTRDALGTFSGLSQRNVAALPANFGVHGLKPAEVPIAMLADYYEHDLEHAPPRDPSGAMQRRERFYLAPHEPFELLRTNLTDSFADRSLRSQLDALETSWHRDGASRPAADLQALTTRSSLSPQILLEAGRGFDFLAGDELAASFFRAAFTKAAAQYQNTQSGDPAALAFLRELEQTKALWRLQDYPALEKRFALAMALYPPLSPDARRSAYLHALAINREGHHEEAAQAILAVDQQHKQAGDLGALDKSDIGEMEWVTATYLYSARQYAQAIPYFQSLLQTGDSRSPNGARLLVNCLTRTGQIQAAQAIRMRYGITAAARLPASAPATSPVPARAVNPPMHINSQRENPSHWLPRHPAGT